MKVTRGTCMSVTKAECALVADSKKIELRGIINPNYNRFPLGCYHKKTKNKDIIYFNAKPSRRRCSYRRACVCKLGKGVDLLSYLRGLWVNRVNIIWTWTFSGQKLFSSPNFIGKFKLASFIFRNFPISYFFIFLYCFFIMLLGTKPMYFRSIEPPQKFTGSYKCYYDIIPQIIIQKYPAQIFKVN